MQSDVSSSPANAAGFQSQADDVFARIASRYDFLCDLFSVGLHRLWKRRVACLIGKESWSDLLECAAGTGDVALRVLDQARLRPDQKITVSDISPQMLDIARWRIDSMGPGVEFKLLDAQSMQGIPNASIDLLSISLGLKICDRDKVLREAMRVLRPNGRLVTLEASNIQTPWLHRTYLAYMSFCMPAIGWLATGGDTSAYRYLLKGVQDFPTAEHFADELTAIGYREVTFERLSLGVVAVHMARKPSER
jgi:demethylmenaquinone methyltransferase/2-methoxy-6-polyprenyl-1,4-benzoquinol methylase